MPVEPLTFEQQLWLAVVDKAVLATVLVGVGLFANRTLEAFKAKEALRAKMAETTLQRLSQQVSAYAEVREAVLE